MCGFQEKVEVSLAWGVPAFGIAYIGEDPRLVKDCPGVYSVAHSFDDDLDIVGKTAGGVAVLAIRPGLRGFAEDPSGRA